MSVRYHIHVVHYSANVCAISHSRCTLQRQCLRYPIHVVHYSANVCNITFTLYITAPVPVRYGVHVVHYNVNVCAISHSRSTLQRQCLCDMAMCSVIFQPRECLDFTAANNFWKRVFVVLNWINPSSRTMALGFTQSLRSVDRNVGIHVLVELRLIFLSAGEWMTTVDGGSFPISPKRFSDFVCLVFVLSYICNAVA
jgi:hypothetical protein